jgi:adenylate cyclase
MENPNRACPPPAEPTQRSRVARPRKPSGEYASIHDERGCELEAAAELAPVSSVRARDACATLPPITVLMIDDDPLMARAAERLLSLGRDIRFHACSDAGEALVLAAKLRPTLILQDMVMPTADGLSMVRSFRASPATREIPILVLSSEEGPNIKASAFAAGADDYIVKFPDRVELLARVRHHAHRYLRGRQQEAAASEVASSRLRHVEESRFLRKTFGRYLSDSVVDRLLESPEALELGGSRRRVTIMMTDLRGFTALSERLSPERMVTLINNYLAVMTEIIVRRGGTIDEFIGDAILALFGAPQQLPDDAERAVACAVEMQLAMTEVNARNRASGLPEVEMGIGLHTGEVVVGNIGSRRRAKYAVVGSAVNLAARIESYTTGGQVLVSEATLKEAGPAVLVADVMEVTPKGVKQPVRIHRVGGMGAPYDLRLAEARAALSAPAAELYASFSVLDGKHGGGARALARIVRCSTEAAEIASRARLPAHANVVLQLVTPGGGAVGGDLYAKVTGPGSEPGTFAVRFTSVPAEAAALLGAGRAASGSAAA